MHSDTRKYNSAQAPSDRAICRLLAEEIDRGLPDAENRIWHAHPVWFLDGNPIVGYSKLKGCVRLLFWSGQSFKEKGLKKEGTFKAAEARYTGADQVDRGKLGRWLAEARDVQWDYKNIVRRKGRLERLPAPKPPGGAPGGARAAARSAAPRPAPRPAPGPAPRKPKLLSGGNPQIPKGDGDAPVQAYIAAMPGWKGEVGRRLDALIAGAVPGVRKAVRWNTPFYGLEGRGWFTAFHCMTRYIKVSFFRGASMQPVPPVESKQKDVRYFHVHEGDPIDGDLLASWMRQAAALPGETCF